MSETGGGSSCMQELEIPPSRNHMGIVQILELVLFGIVAILCVVDLIVQIKNLSFTSWAILAIVCDILFIVGVVYIIIGLFCNFTEQKIKIGIYCFFGAMIIQLVFIVSNWVKTSRVIDWILNLLKIIVMVFLCWLLWRQSKNVGG